MQHPSPRRLLLFDIDGTLLTTGGAGERGFGEAFHEAFGIHDDLATINFAGATDTLITRMLFDKHGLPETPGNHARFKTAYLPRLAANVSLLPGRVMPGIVELLPALRERPEEFALGLLTGNYEAAARIKLERYGLAAFFPFGAFADDSHDRDLLGPVALRRARERFGSRAFADPARDVLILGDTPRDIACARACGARVLAVATGRHPREDLAGYSPDFLFDTLADPGVWETLVGAA